MTNAATLFEIAHPTKPSGVKSPELKMSKIHEMMEENGEGLTLVILAGVGAP